MKVTILCVGKVKESFFRDAFAEYAKRLFAYCRLEVIEVADEKTIEGHENLAISKEGERLLAKLPENAYVAALCIDGKMRSSEAMADWMQERMNHGVSHLVLIIGGSCGLSKEVLAKVDERISFGPMTFPHQLMRVILAEQLYRSFRIMKGEPYHK